MRFAPAVLIVLLAAYPLVATLPFPQHIVIMALLFATMGTAWNILGGLRTFEWIRRRRLGLILTAVREEEDAARSLGVDTMRYKLVALIVSAAFTTLCGMFYAHYVQYVEPISTTSLVMSIEIAFIAIFGGIGTVWVPTLAAFVIIPLSELLRAYLSGRMA